MSLQQWPLELIEWPSRNSQRRDVSVAHDVGRFDEVMATHVLPANERSQPRWNGDPFTLDSWSGGETSEVDPGPWLLAYWSARWHSLVWKSRVGSQAQYAPLGLWVGCIQYTGSFQGFAVGTLLVDPF